ncbi:hypothetical protein NADFUDRAFT_80842 [Nadsonia fulvescens var. elongata DSM 6958]|uniref:Protein PNS1 n=1 Tax=Nadsonia fulvescens var. elongata DSM 6958 TaxID=857566 RepID=A0A1E3PCW8_9ASCO|nr:hypothetical protein NADFUDRAFT_80842 [Nadsonia fulvescens var. elongata DSM 6958]
MFSEYASKFLTQSHSRLSSIHMPLNQYSNAPLFYSTADYDPAEDLGRGNAPVHSVYSRYANYIQESESEDDDDVSNTEDINYKRYNTGIGSSWKGYDEDNDNNNDTHAGYDPEASHSSGSNSPRRLNNLESIELNPDEEEEDELTPGAAFIENGAGTDVDRYNDIDSPPADITFEPRADKTPHAKTRNKGFGIQSYLNHNEPVYNETKEISIIPHLSHPRMNMVWYDALWSTLFIFLTAAMFATSMIIWFTTSVPSTIPDTIYSSIISNITLLLKYTIWASMLSIAWFVVLVKHSRSLFHLSLISVPVLLIYISFYTYSMSFRSSHGGFTLQDKLMRLTTSIPLIMAMLWGWVIYKSQSRIQATLNLISRTIVILKEFQLPLIYLSMGSVVCYALFSLVWLSMFCHLFLQGHNLISSGGRLTWSLSPKAWLLGVFYVLMYIWTYFIIAGIGRAATAATVGQYWFHKNTFPSVSPDRVIVAALQYAISTQFGSICLSSLITLLLRLPLLLAPTRLFPLLRLLHIPINITLNMTPLAMARNRLRTLSDPLSLTRSIITGSSLLNAFPGQQSAEYWIAKLFISSTRIVVCLMFGFFAWVHATTATPDRNDSTSTTIGGSLYGYIVGLLVGWWTWVVMSGSGAVVDGVLDGMVVCQSIRSNGILSDTESSNTYSNETDEDYYLYGSAGWA